jgi:hypothetical protein
MNLQVQSVSIAFGFGIDGSTLVRFPFSLGLSIHVGLTHTKKSTDTDVW